MALSEYGRQFTPVPAGETVVFTHPKMDVDAGQPVNITYVNAIVDKGLATETAITGVTMVNTSCILITAGIVQTYQVTFTLTGEYGEDLATRDIYQVINSNNYIEDQPSFYGSDSKPEGDFVVTTYNSYSTLIANRAPTHSSKTGWNHLIKFYPDDSLEKLAVFNFQGTVSANSGIIQYVHLIPTRHFTRLNSLVNSVYVEENPEDPTRVVQQYQFEADTFTGNGVLTTFGPLSRTPSYKPGTTEYNIAVYFEGSSIVVTPSMYTVNGNFITFTSPPPAGPIKIYPTEDSGAWLSEGQGVDTPPSYTTNPPGWT
jgi:hypothetical protein